MKTRSLSIAYCLRASPQCQLDGGVFARRVAILRRTFPAPECSAAIQNISAASGLGLPLLECLLGPVTGMEHDESRVASKRVILRRQLHSILGRGIVLLLDHTMKFGLLDFGGIVVQGRGHELNDARQNLKATDHVGGRPPKSESIELLELS